MLWDVVYPDVGPDHELVDGQTFHVGGVELHGAAHAGSLAGQHMSVRTRPRRRLHRRHAVRRRPGSDRTVVLGLLDDSSSRSATGCSRSRTTRSCTPATATTRRSEPRLRTSTTGSPADTDSSSRACGPVGFEARALRATRTSTNDSPLRACGPVGFEARALRATRTSTNDHRHPLVEVRAERASKPAHRGPADRLVSRLGRFAPLAPQPTTAS